MHEPEFHRIEGLDFALPLHDHPNRDRLDAPGRQSALNLLPEDRRQGISDQPVQGPARKLRLVHLRVQLARVLQSTPNRVLGDFVEKNPAGHRRDLGNLFGDVPADGLPLTVGVGCDEDLVGLGSRLADPFDDLLLAMDDLQLRFEAVIHVNGQRTLRKVLDMAGRRFDLVPARQVFLDGGRLGRRLDNNQRLAHEMFLERGKNAENIPANSRMNK